MAHCEKNWQRMIIHPLGFMNCGREHNRNGTISEQKLLKIKKTLCHLDSKQYEKMKENGQNINLETLF